jgi:Bacterial protein of unknown function (DUF916)
VTTTGGPAAFVIATVVGLLSGGTATSAATGGIGVAPAHSDPSRPVTQAYFALEVSPGGNASDAVVVSNTASAPANVLVYAVDGVTGATSGAVYANRGDPVHRAGAWITVAASSITVPAESRSTVAFTVRVPAGTASGDHLAGIAFENAHPSTSAGRLAVTTVSRSVIGILVHVPGPSTFHLHIDRAQIVQQPGGGPEVVLTLGNDGTVIGKPSLALTVYGPSGYQRFVYRELDTLLPGDTIPYPVPLPDSLAGGDYRVEVSGAEASMPAPVSLFSTVRVGYGVLGVAATRSPTVADSPASHSDGVPLWLIAPLVAASLAGVAVGAVLGRGLAHRS